MPSAQSYLRKPSMYLIALFVAIILAFAAAIIAGFLTYGHDSAPTGTTQHTPAARPCGKYGYAQQAANPYIRCQ